MSPRDTLAAELREVWTTESINGSWHSAWLAIAALVERKIVEAQREAWKQGWREEAAFQPHEAHLTRGASNRYPLPVEAVPARPGKIEPLHLWEPRTADLTEKVNEIISALNALREATE